MTDSFPDPSPPTDAPSAATPLRLYPFDKWGIRIAWVVIFLTVGLIVGVNLWITYSGRRAKIEAKWAEADPADVHSVTLKLTGYLVIGQHQILGESHAAEQAEQVRASADSPLEHLRAVPIIAELEGREAALRELDGLQLPPASASAASGRPTTTATTAPAESRLSVDADRFRSIYTAGPDSLPPSARNSLIDRHGWFAKLALTSGKPSSDPARAAVLAPATRAFWIYIPLLLAGIPVLLGGVVLFIFAMVFVAQRRVRRAYRFVGLPPEGPYAPDQPMLAPRGLAADHLPLPPGPYAYPQYVYAPPPGAAPSLALPPGAAPVLPYGWAAPLPQFAASRPPGPAWPEAPSLPLVPTRTGPFLEAFAIYLGGQILLAMLIHFLFRGMSFANEWWLLLLLPVAFFWPVVRGVSWRELRRGLGWHRGRGVFREMGAGLLGYLGGLPVLALGMLVTGLLTRMAHTRAEHPIENEIGPGLWNHLQIYLLACVWAPIVEETMFRGALLHHLRQRWRWLSAAPIVALLFAAIHPQGWAGIPALGAIAIMLAALREWRGSTIASMTAHFLQNFMVTTFLVLLLG